MLVREVINIALRLIGVSTPGVIDRGDDQFNNNLRQLQLVVDGLRNRYPYKVSETIAVPDIGTANFVSIDSMVSFPTGSEDEIQNPRLPMRSVTLDEYNDLNVNPNVRGWPQAYYLQLPYTIKIWPNDPGYSVTITGKINTALNLTANTQLDASPLFFQDYISTATAEKLAPFYNKPWTMDMKKAMATCERNLFQNTDYDFAFCSKSSNLMDGMFRAKYLLNGGG